MIEVDEYEYACDACATKIKADLAPSRVCSICERYACDYCGTAAKNAISEKTTWFCSECWESGEETRKLVSELRRQIEHALGVWRHAARQKAKAAMEAKP